MCGTDARMANIKIPSHVSVVDFSFELCGGTASRSLRLRLCSKSTKTNETTKMNIQFAPLRTEHIYFVYSAGR